VSFFEIVSAAGGEARRMRSSLEWDTFLADLSQVPLAQRAVESDTQMVGTIATYDMQDHLLLHRVKDPGEWLSVVNWDTEDLRELEQSDREGYLDTSVMCFLPFGNIVGIMPGNRSSPSHKGLETWLNGIRYFSDRRLQVRPVVAHSEVERLKKATGASRIEVKLMSNKMGELRNRSGGLARSLRLAGEDYGEITVTLVISIPRGRGSQSDRERLLSDLNEISDLVTGAERARARLVYVDPEGPERTELVELVEHSITAKRRVPATDSDGNSIRILSAVDAILSAAVEHEDALRLAVDAVEM